MFKSKSTRHIQVIHCSKKSSVSTCIFVTCSLSKSPHEKKPCFSLASFLLLFFQLNIGPGELELVEETGEEANWGVGGRGKPAQIIEAQKNR